MGVYIGLYFVIQGLSAIFRQLVKYWFVFNHIRYIHVTSGLFRVGLRVLGSSPSPCQAGQAWPAGRQ